MSYCDYCGEETGTIVKLCKTMEGHVRCFVLQNVFEVLNRGSELKCPAGKWNVSWLEELDRYVRPEIAGQVRQLMEVLIQAGMDDDAISSDSRQMLKEMKAHSDDKDALDIYLLKAAP